MFVEIRRGAFRWLHGALLIFAGLAVVIGAPRAAAQSEPVPFPAEQPGLWETATFNGPPAYAGSAERACDIQRDEFNPNATPQPATYTNDHTYSCHWIPRQLGGPDNSNTVLPAVVTLRCPPGDYVRVQGQCLLATARAPECTDNCPGKDGPVSGPETPKVGNPISITSGYKVLAERDYATADGLLAIDRQYLSRAGLGWRILFPAYLEMSGSARESVTFYSRAGGEDNFVAQNPSDPDNWTFSRPSFFGDPLNNSRRRLSMVSTPSVNRYAFFDDSAIAGSNPPEMRVDMANGEYILFRRANAADLLEGRRLLVPVEHGRPGGYVQWYDYADATPFPTKLRDSLGREIALSWTDAPGDAPASEFAQSKVLEVAALPDATVLRYSYDEGGGSSAGYSAGPPQWAIDQGLVVRTVGGLTNFVVPGRKNRLRSVTREDGTGAVLWQRHYDYQKDGQPNALTRVRDQNGATLATYSYVGDGKLESSALAGGVNAYSFEHFQIMANGVIDGRSQMRRVTGPLGRVDEYHLYRRENAWPIEPWAITRIAGQATSTTPADEELRGYADSFGIKLLLNSATDKLGRVTNFALDLAQGRPTAMQEAVGTPQERGTTIAWHPTLDLPTRIERDGLRIDISYTADAMVESQTLTDLTAHNVPYSTNGQTRTTTYSWGPNARLLSVNGPRPVNAQGKDDTVTFAYDAAGNVTTMTNGLGHVTSFAGYDANGRPATMTDANGVVTQFSYDALGRVASVRVKHPTTATLDAVTSFSYDAEGRVTSIAAPASTPLTMTYDLAGRLTAVVASNGERIDYSHDAMGNVIGETVKRVNGTAATSITRTFDALGRMLTETLGPGRTWTYSYDKVGNLTGLASPRNQSTAQSFDALDRLVAQAMPDGGAPAFAYDARDGLTQHGDAIGVQTQFVRNGFGEVIQEISPDRGTSVYVYDSAGDMVSATDGRGQQINYVHDILGRLTSAVPVGRPASETITYTWDTPVISGSRSVGRLSRIVDSGTTVEYRYDHRGNVTLKRQRIGTGAWFSLYFAYDLADRRTQITYPSGRIVSYSWNTLGRVTQVRTKANSSVTAWTTLSSGMAYESFGALTRATYGNGLRMVQSWGNDGRLANRRLERVADGVRLSSLTYLYDNSDNITRISDTLDTSRTRNFAYDAMERLTRVQGVLGGFAREDYLHDANGNRLTVERRTSVGAATPAESDSYSIAPGTNRVTAIATPAGTRSFTHDARGNQTGETRPDGSAVSVSYDGRARLVGYGVGASAQAMLYNGADERVRVVTTQGGTTDTRQFVYDLDHRIVGEYGAGGAGELRAEYIWTLPGVGTAGPTGGDDGTGGYSPLAVAVGVTGPGGITSEIQWVHGNHLGTPIVTTDASGAAVTPYGYAAIGFPGQFANALQLPGAEHYYNRYRDYDPTTGRYIQADPIGLAGDANAWAYAGGNPLAQVDPLGLLSWRDIANYVPVVGSGLDAWDAYQCGNYGWALVHAGLAITDLSGGGALVKGFAVGTFRWGSRGAVRAAYRNAHNWPQMRRALQSDGLLPVNAMTTPRPEWVTVDHIIVKQHYNLPHWITNHPANLQREISQGLNWRFESMSYAERALYAPTWMKVGGAGMASYVTGSMLGSN